jgi:hypothetical protein
MSNIVTIVNEYEIVTSVGDLVELRGTAFHEEDGNVTVYLHREPIAFFNNPSSVVLKVGND